MNQYRIIYQTPGQAQPGSVKIYAWDEDGARSQFEDEYPEYEILDVEPLNIK